MTTTIIKTKLTSSANGSQGTTKKAMHAKAAARKKQRSATYYGLRDAKPDKPILPCVITLTRIGGRRMDSDNLGRALKSVRDGVADYLGVDDGDPRITWEWGHGAEKLKKGELHRVRIEWPDSHLRKWDVTFATSTETVNISARSEQEAVEVAVRYVATGAHCYQFGALAVEVDE